VPVCHIHLAHLPQASYGLSGLVSVSPSHYHLMFMSLIVLLSHGEFLRQETHWVTCLSVRSLSVQVLTQDLDPLQMTHMGSVLLASIGFSIGAL